MASRFRVKSDESARRKVAIHYAYDFADPTQMFSFKRNLLKINNLSTFALLSSRKSLYIRKKDIDDAPLWSNIIDVS